jgi:hypothetical protein
VRVPGADHYFTERIDEMKDAVRDYFTRGPGAAAFPSGDGDSDSKSDQEVRHAKP